MKSYPVSLRVRVYDNLSWIRVTFRAFNLSGHLNATYSLIGVVAGLEDFHHSQTGVVADQVTLSTNELLENAKCQCSGVALK